jgi:probable HAF family extracellular repeat protein
MVDLSRGAPENSSGTAINNKGQVAGAAQLRASHVVHASIWTPRTARLDLGALAPGLSSDATVINDAGMIAGGAESGSGGPFSQVAIRWTKAEGLRTFGTLPSEFTFSSDINAAGHIVGESPFPPGGEPHAFLWTQRAGLLDLGTGTLTRSIALALNDHDVVVGQTLRMFVGPIYGFIWTLATGLVELKSKSPDLTASANDVNNRDQVVGGIDNHAFVWTRAEGVVDLNTRIPGAPAGLKLLAATKISENGSIVASANTGLVLLVPHCGCSKDAAPAGAAE